MKLKHSTLLFICTIFLLFSCKKKETTPEETVDPVAPVTVNNMIKLGETYILGANAKATVYSKKSLETGFNEIYVAFFDSTDGSKLLNGHFGITPLLDTGMIQQSSPAENNLDSVAVNDYFKSAVVFSMPGVPTQWSLNLSFHNHKNGKLGTGKIGVTVIASSPSKFNSTILTLDNNTTVFISLIKPIAPVVGINDFEIVLHKKNNLMSYSPIDNYTIEIDPIMPSMGHGSPNNVNPTNTSLGHYSGKVNFTMSGLWKVNLKIYKNSVLISNDQYFSMTIPQ